MSWTEEDWMIIDSTLNRVAKFLRKIEQEEKKRKAQNEQEVTPVVLPSPTKPITTKQD